MKIKLNNVKLLVVGFLCVVSLSLIGCGGGGGSGSPTQNINLADSLATGTNVLKTPNALFNYTSNSANLAVDIPADSSSAYFALSVCNTESSAQNVSIQPESFVLANTVEPSLMQSKQLSDPVELHLMKNQANIDKVMRLQAENNLRSSQRHGLLRSIRASDDSNEKVGDVVPIKIISNYSGTSYISRNCKLVRLGTHCKIFVDQDPYPYNGLSATQYMSDADYDEFMTQYDTVIWPLITGSYSPIYDIDHDKRVSVVFSPVYTKLGFAGLFNSNNFQDNENSNHRDMIAIFSPDPTNWWGHDKWLPAARETLAHESQHLANYSAHFYFDPIVGKMEAEWLDEGLAVSVEARYRILHGDDPSENRFKLWADAPSSVGLMPFTRALSQYGMVGLFCFYLYEQGGSDAIKSIVQTSGALGVDNINNVFKDQGGMNEMFKRWSIAALMEGAQHHGIVDLSKVDSKYKYHAALNLPVEYTLLSYGQSAASISIPSYGVALYVLRQPLGFSSDSYRFSVKSDSGKNISVVMMRLPK